LGKHAVKIDYAIQGFHKEDYKPRVGRRLISRSARIAPLIKNSFMLRELKKVKDQHKNNAG